MNGGPVATPMSLDLLAGIVQPPPVILPATPTILVFDSGLGGLTVLSEVARGRPDARIVYAADDAAFPYGAWREAELVERVGAVMSRLIGDHGPDLAVIACHTASTLVLPALRARFDLPFVGTVPAIKPAAERSRTGRVAVLATPGTVRRDYTRGLIEAFAGGCRVDLVGATRLATYAEAELSGRPVPDAAIAAEIAPCFVDTDGRRTDVVVLACTHYPLLLPRLQALAPWPVTWIDPAPAIARRVVSLLGSPSAPPAARVGGCGLAVFTGAGRISAPLRTALALRGLGEVRTGLLPLASAPALT